jgi:aspartate/glutamate:proton symporter, AGT family (TC 2.A.3.11.1)
MKKTLNLLQLTFASTSAIIGSGWLLGVYVSAKYAGPASILSWFISGFAVMLIALVYSELGACFLRRAVLQDTRNIRTAHFLGL